MSDIYQHKIIELDGIFTPSAPIVSKDLFIGRLKQIEQVTDAIFEHGQHAALYGERGVGKTSLANTINDFLVSKIVSTKVTCNRNDNFATLWKKTFDKITVKQDLKAIGFNKDNEQENIPLSSYLPPDDNFSPSSIVAIFENFRDSFMLLIFDEFDTISSKEKVKFADLIKELSDNIPNITILVVGIAENINNLVGEHESIERCLRQIKMPRMSNEELSQIVENGLQKLEMTIGEKFKSTIIHLSQGFPHFTHLLCKYSVKAALDDKSLDISKSNLTTAIKGAVENANESIKNIYQKATLTSKENTRFEDVVGACAMAYQDEFSTFSTRDILSGYTKICGVELKPQNITYNLGKLCQPERGPILEKVGKGTRIKYRFKNPLLRVFVILKLSLDDKLKSMA